MTEYDFELPKHVDQDAIELYLDQLFHKDGLALTLKGTLRSYPGCIHWHLKQPGLSGTLEMTWWPAKKRLWAKVAAHRNAEWIAQAVEEIAAKLLCD